MPVQAVSNVQVTPQQVVQQSTKDLAEFYRLAEQHGVSLAVDGSNQYYLRIKVQFSTGQGEKMLKVDRDLALAIMNTLKTGGRISRAEVLNPIMTKITDGGKYGAGEAVLARLLLAACDDRKKVLIDGDRINITDVAEKTLNHELHSFWGRLGAKARWGDDDPGVMPTPPPQMQSGGYAIKDGMSK